MANKMIGRLYSIAHNCASPPKSRTTRAHGLQSLVVVALVLATQAHLARASGAAGGQRPESRRLFGEPRQLDHEPLEPMTGPQVEALERMQPRAGLHAAGLHAFGLSQPRPAASRQRALRAEDLVAKVVYKAKKEAKKTKKKLKKKLHKLGHKIKHKIHHHLHH